MIAQVRILGAALAVAVTMLVLAIAAPQFGDSDIHAYKGAGVGLAEGRGLTAALVMGNPSQRPEVFAGYPPGFPALFGGFSMIVGLGASENTAFELLSGCLLALSLLWAWRPALLLLPRWQQAIAGALLVLAAPAVGGLARDRPDALALAMAVATMTLYRRRPLPLPWAALGCGFVALLSPLVALLLALGVASLWARLQPGGRLPLARAVPVCALLALLPLSVAVALLQVSDSSYLPRFFGNLLGSGADTTDLGWTTGAGSFVGLLRGDAAAFWRDLIGSYGAAQHYAQTAKLLSAGLLAMLALVLLGRGVRGRPWALAVVATTLLVSLVAVPWNKHYGAVGAIFLAGLLPLWLDAASRRAAWLTLAPGAVALVIAAPFAAQDLIARLYASPSLGRMQAAIDRLDLRDRNGDGRLLVISSSAHYPMFVGQGAEVVTWSHLGTLRSEVRAAADYLAFGHGATGDSHRAGVPVGVNPIAEGFDLVYRPALPQVPSIFGIPMGRSSRTWEVELWERRPP